MLEPGSQKPMGGGALKPREVDETGAVAPEQTTGTFSGTAMFVVY